MSATDSREWLSSSHNLYSFFISIVRAGNSITVLAGHSQLSAVVTAQQSEWRKGN
jgi:hypothetical protein